MIRVCVCMNCDNKISDSTNKDIKRCGRCSRLKREEQQKRKGEEE